MVWMFFLYLLDAPCNAYNVEDLWYIHAGHGWVHGMVRKLMKMWPFLKLATMSPKDHDAQRFMVSNINFCCFPLLFGPLHAVCKYIANAKLLNRI